MRGWLGRLPTACSESPAGYRRKRANAVISKAPSGNATVSNQRKKRGAAQDGMTGQWRTRSTVARR
jgi:hypothetical protein